MRDTGLAGVARERLSALSDPHRGILASSSVLGVQSAVLATSGLLFWLVAARVYSADEVGEAGGLVTLTLLGDYLSAFGLPIVVARYANRRGRSDGAVFSLMVLVTACTSAATAVVVVNVASEDFAGPLIAHGRLVGGLLYFLAVNGLAWTTLIDNRLLGLGQGRGLLVRHIALAVVRLVLVGLALVSPDALWIWMATSSTVMAAVALAMVVQRADLGPYTLRADLDWAAIGRFAGVNFISTLLAMAPFIILPLVVFAHVEASTNAAFHIAWTVAAVAFLIPNLVSRALLIRAEGSPDSVMHQARLSAAMSLGIGALIVALSVPASLLIPWLYGSGYEDSGAYLVILLAGLLPYAVTANTLSLARIHHDTGATLTVSAALALAVVVPGIAVVPESGATGAAWTWLIGHGACAVVAAALLPRLVRVRAAGT